MVDLKKIASSIALRMCERKYRIFKYGKVAVDVPDAQIFIEDIYCPKCKTFSAYIFFGHGFFEYKCKRCDSRIYEINCSCLHD